MNAVIQASWLTVWSLMAKVGLNYFEGKSTANQKTIISHFYFLIKMLPDGL